MPEITFGLGRIVGKNRTVAELAAQVGMVGPMSTMLMGVLLLGEPFTVWLVCGTGLVLAGVAVCSRARRA